MNKEKYLGVFMKKVCLILIIIIGVVTTYGMDVGNSILNGSGTIELHDKIIDVKVSFDPNECVITLVGKDGFKRVYRVEVKDKNGNGWLAHHQYFYGTDWKNNASSKTSMLVITAYSAVYYLEQNKKEMPIYIIAVVNPTEKRLMHLNFFVDLPWSVLDNPFASIEFNIE